MKIENINIRVAGMNINPRIATVGSDNVKYIQSEKRERVLSLEEMEEKLLLLIQEEIRLQKRIASLSKLPETLLKMSHEDWCSVFSAVVKSSKNDLLNCRLVCRKWNDTIVKYHNLLCAPSEKYTQSLKILALEDTFPLHVRMSRNQMFIFFTLIPFAEWYARDLVVECLKKFEFKFLGLRDAKGVYIAVNQLRLDFNPRPCQIEIACDFNFNFKELTVDAGQLELSMLQWFRFSYSFTNSQAFVCFPTLLDKK